MRIDGCRAVHYRLPREVWWPVRLEDRTLTIETLELVTFEVETALGIGGLGYTYTLGRGGAAVHALVEEMGTLLLGRELRSAAGAWESLWLAFQRVGRGGVVSVALAALDMALWDALAKAAGLPLYRYLGAERGRVPAYGSSIDLGYPLEELLDTVRAHVERGFDAVKVKVGRPVAEDIERLEAVRDAIGPDRRLMVDANVGWKLPEAARRAHLMERFDLLWLEEPLDPDDVEGHVRLQAQTSIALAAGETLFSVAEFASYLRAGGLRYIQADVGRLGGITPWLRVAELAHAAHLSMAPHFMQDVHVHLLCAIPNGEILEHLPLFDAVLEKPLSVQTDGTVSPPELPGIGVCFRHELLEAYRVMPSESTQR